MPAPTIVQAAQPSGTPWLSTATSKTTTSFDALNGDILVVLGATSDNSTTIAISNSGTALTWTQRAASNTGSTCKVYIWTAPLTADRTALTVTVTRAGSTANQLGCIAYTIRNHGGVGLTPATVRQNTNGTTPTVTLNPASANSAIFGIVADWTAGDGTTRSFSTATAGTYTESVYQRDSGTYTVYAGYHANAGAAGSKSFSRTLPTAGDDQAAAIEILGTSTTPSGTAKSTTGASSAAQGRRRTAGAGASTTGTQTVASGRRRARGTASSSAGSRSIASGVPGNPEWEPIGGATAAGYTLTGDDLGASVRCVVVATNTAGSTEAVSNELGPVEAEQGAGVANSSTGARSTASGRRRSIGAALSAAGSRSFAAGTGTASGWENISGATAATYVLTGDDLGAELRCIVTASNAAGSAGSPSNAFGPVAPTGSAGSAVSTTGARSTAAGRRRSTGSARSSTGSRSSATGTDGAAQVWTPISGATGATYLLQPDDDAAEIRCIVTASNTAGSAQATSNALGPVEPAVGASGSASSSTGARSTASGSRRSVSSHEVLGPVPPFTEQAPGARSTTGARSAAAGQVGGPVQQPTGTAASSTGTRSTAGGTRRSRGSCTSTTGARSTASGTNPTGPIRSGSAISSTGAFTAATGRRASFGSAQSTTGARSTARGREPVAGPGVVLAEARPGRVSEPRTGRATNQGVLIA